MYETTPAGRAAFRAWLATPPAPPALEAEALLRLLFADQGDGRQLLATMETLAKQTQALYDDGMQILAGYAEGTAPFPERLHLSLFAAFQSDLYRLILDWARFAGREVRSWERTDGLGRIERVQEILETLLAGRSALDDPA